MGRVTMIKKELVTIQSEAWFDEAKEHRYVFRLQWVNSSKEADKENSLAVVVTIHPGSVAAHVEDLTMLLVENNIRQLGFNGFIAVNLFSSTQANYKKQSDGNTLEIISTVLKEKQISQIIFIILMAKD